jgi:hypothetical protein
MNYNLFFIFNLFVPKSYDFKSFTWVIMHLDFVGFFFGLLNLKMTSVTFNTNFHIYLGRFVND